MSVEQEQVSTWKPGQTPRCGCGAERKVWRAYCPRCQRVKRGIHAELNSEAKRRANARSYLNVYVRRGAVAKQPCASCGAVEVEAHHADYAQPLEVTWLCRPCHLKLHGVEVKRRPRGSKADGEAGKPPELFEFYQSLHARGESTETLAAALLVSGGTVRKLVIGLKPRRGPVWRSLELRLTERERALLASSATSAFVQAREARRARWTEDKAAAVRAAQT